MNLFWGLVIGVLSYFISQLVFNEVVSALLALVVGFAVAFGYDRAFPRR